MGSGAIGAEFASFYQNMGAEVTIIEVMDRILPVEDAEISAFVHKAFVKQGMKILTGAPGQGIRKGADSVTAVVEAGGKVQDIVADRLIDSWPACWTVAPIVTVEEVVTEAIAAPPIDKMIHAPAKAKGKRRG